MEQFLCQTKILAGNNILSALRELHPKRLFLVTDPFFRKNGWADRVIQASGAAHWEIFDQVVPDPSVTLAATGAAKVREFDPDLLVALGGGSAMDCAKAMNYFGTNCPLAAIPTTSGSGSEVTDFAILTHENCKHPLMDPKLRPVLALLEEELLTELPKSLIADTGFDVLAHALEAAVGTKGGNFTDALARESFRMAFQNLPRSFAGDKSLRLTVHKASAMAGLAFTQEGLGLCHALSHALGGAFHVPHGRLNAILLPAVLMTNAPQAQEKYAVLARHAGFTAASDTIAIRNLKNGLVKLRRELRLPETLAQAGVDLAQLRIQEQQIITAALADPCCLTNPVKPEAHMLRAILAEVSGHG